MDLKFNTKIDYFNFFIIIIKIIFVLSAVSHIILSYSAYYVNEKIDERLLSIKEHTKVIFEVSMAILLIYFFYPGKKREVPDETSSLFFLFGCVIIITTEWKNFFTTLKF
jgi:ABC-type dipeptide/oligopeptide/nickel transport system permease subunit